MSLVKNDRDFDVKVTYTENEEAKEAVIAAGAELEVPEDQVEAVTRQVAEAVKPADKEDGDEELSDEDKKAKELADREAAAEARETAVAAKEKELSDKAAEADFATLLSEGKVVPAQKPAFIALSSQSDVTIELSDGVKKSVSVLLSEFLGKMPKGLNLSDEEGVPGGDKDDVELTSEEQSLTELGLSEEDIKETKKQEGAK